MCWFYYPPVAVGLGNYCLGITGKKAITSFITVIVFITRCADCALRMCTIHVDYNYFMFL